MKSALDQFVANLAQARHLGGLYEALRANTTSALDLSDMVRAELVMATSALDHYIHELTRIGMINTLLGLRPPAPRFLKFSIPMEKVLAATKDPSSATWLDEEVRFRHGFQSFQNPEKIADAIGIISDISLWDTVAQKMGMSREVLKTQLAEIVDRRNKIAHEADMDHASGRRRPINSAEVQEQVAFLEKVGQAIYEAVS